MKKSILFTFAAMLFTGYLFGQATQLVLTTSSVAATQCTTPCNGTATVVSVTGGTPPYTYLWNIPLAPQQTQTATGLCPGTYQVGVFDAATPLPNQGQAMVTVTCNTASGINSVVDSKNDFIIYPNPAHDQLSLAGANMINGNSEIKIVNMLGMLVYSESMNTIGTLNKTINVASLPSGVYSVEFSVGNESTRKKFIKQ